MNNSNPVETMIAKKTGLVTTLGDSASTSGKTELEVDSSDVNSNIAPCPQVFLALFLYVFIEANYDIVYIVYKLKQSMELGAEEHTPDKIEVLIACQSIVGMCCQKLSLIHI